MTYFISFNLLVAELEAASDWLVVLGGTSPKLAVTPSAIVGSHHSQRLT